MSKRQERFNRSDIEIDDEKLEERVARIRPCVMRDGVLHYIAPPSTLRNTAFTWSPTLLEPVGPYRELLVNETVHTYGAPTFFKPSLAEVMAQASDIEPFANAFWLDADDIGFTSDSGAHVVTCHWIRTDGD